MLKKVVALLAMLSAKQCVSVTVARSKQKEDGEFTFRRTEWQKMI
jgi:hypothetical protein